MSRLRCSLGRHDWHAALTWDGSAARVVCFRCWVRSPPLTLPTPPRWPATALVRALLEGREVTERQLLGVDRLELARLTATMAGAAGAADPAKLLDVITTTPMDPDG